MKLSLINFLWILLLGTADAATVAFNQDSVDDADAGIIGAVSVNEFRETGMSYSTISAPASFDTFRFTHWTNSSYPSTAYRDAWGRSLNPISFTLLEATTCTARYLPETLDTDSDGLPDWYEIEYYGNLLQGTASDSDGDGIALQTEYDSGKHPLFGNSQQAGGVAYTDSTLVTFNRNAYPTYTLRSEPTGTVNESAVVPPSTVVTTPDLGESNFGYWTLDGVPQRDAWGAALRQISFTMGVTNREATAYLFDDDVDTDGLPDAWEWYYFGTTALGAGTDFNGDGFTLLQDYQATRAPTFGYAFQAGGVALADSELVTINLAGFSRYTLGSVPTGTVNQTAVVSDGTTITTPNMAQSTFGYWTLDGVRQQDAWGVATRQITFTVNGADRTAVAHLFANDSDGDGINDGFEQFHFGTLANGAASDTDGDSISLLAEFTGGTNPRYGNFSQIGGVAWADSSLVVVNLQPYERLSKLLVNNTLTDFFSPDPGVVTGIDAGNWSAMAVTDWDGDGDLDLFVAHESGLRVFRNVGTARNPNFEEITSGFAGLTAFINNIDRPILTGGDWNGDGFGDLVIGGNTGTLRLIASSGAFNSNGTGIELAVGSSNARPALGDMNGDGKSDLMVLLDDGTTRLYLNNGTSLPFAGPGTNNFLGVAAPAGTSIATGDINQDGLPDVLLADADGRIWEFLNNGSGGFSLQSKVWGGSFPGFAAGLTLAAADLEGDGDLDLIGGLANGGVIALRDPSVGRPTGLVAKPGADSIQLDWDANWQSRIRGYFIYRASAAAGPWAKLISNYVPLPSYLDTSVDPAAMNYYYVSGVSYFFLPGNSEPRIVESLPSDLAITQAGKVILSVRPVNGKSGQRVKINLSIENAVGVSGSGLQVRVAYDPAKLQPWAQADPGEETVLSTGLSRNLTFTDNGATANGELIINGSGGSLEPGAGKLFTLQFEVAAGLPKKSTLSVTISGATMRDLNGNSLVIEILPQDQPEVEDVFVEGDLSGDGLVTNADKDLLKDLLKPKSRPPTEDELMAGDLNGDGKLDSKDLVLMMQLLNSL
ncbi:MAG: FG-GAP-like repeat-containing protein [Luteolibacter sp.]